jgi:hypothetical protein
VPALGEDAVVARVVGEGRPHARGDAVVEDVGERQVLERGHRARCAEERGRRLRGDLVGLERVGDRRAQLGVDDGVAERERATERRLGELVVDAELVVQAERGGVRAVEEVRLVQAQIDLLTEPGDLRLEREGLAVALQVGLLHLRRRDEVLDAREARADLEGAGGLLETSNVTSTLPGSLGSWDVDMSTRSK